MSRPKPTIIASLQLGSTTTEVCAAAAVYAVYYQGKPVKVRTHGDDMMNGFKYAKSSFPEPGHAVRLAQKLNRELNTTDFSVVELKIGRVIPLI
jgi:hypothetical protein